MMSADKWDHKKNCPCLACRDADRYFANALRNFLGLCPLYMDGRNASRGRNQVKRNFRVPRVET